MTTYIQRTLLLVTLVVFFSLTMDAQEAESEKQDTSKSNELDLEQVEVVKEFDARIARVKMIQVEPSIETPQTNIKTYDYNITAVPVDVNYPAPVIRPLAMRPALSDDSKSHWARLGYSTLNSPYASLGSSIRYDELFGIDLYGHYNGGSDTEPDRDYQGIDIDLGGFYNIDLFQIYGDINFDRKQSLLTNDNRFMIDPTLDFDRVNYQNGVSLGIRNMNKEGANLIYDVNAAWTLSNTNASLFSGSENDLLLDGDATYTFGDFNLVNFNIKNHLTSYQDSTDYLADAEISSRFSYDQFAFGVGIDAAYVNDAPVIWPKLSIELFNIAKHYIQLSSDQQVTKNSLNEILSLNQFIDPSQDFYQNRIKQSVSLEVKTNTDQILDYGINASYDIITNQATFLNSADDLRLFAIRYEDFQQISLRFDCSYELGELFSVNGQVVKQFFILEDGQELFHIPSLQAKGSIGAYLLDDDRLHVGATFTGTEATQYQDLDFVIQKNNWQYDLSIEADYNFSDHVGLFVKGNNLLNNQYSLLNGYPTFGIHLIGGVQVQF